MSEQMPVSAMVIKVDGTIEIKTIDGDCKSLQTEVGGWIELVRLDGGISMYINEEGKLEGLPVNVVATMIALQSGLAPDDYIVGDVVFLGKGTADGRETSVSADFAKKICLWATKHHDKLNFAIQMATRKEGV
jgi:hypothetical protein